ncbi:MAG: hypothetical protein FJY85_07430, partial [Deltaproteobacteria bacterium]|nr:hypothetical protein [Deltaproteobacteria bacterium]
MVGVSILITGGDGAGVSTQARLLCDWLLKCKGERGCVKRVAVGKEPASLGNQDALGSWSALVGKQVKDLERNDLFSLPKTEQYRYFFGVALSYFLLDLEVTRPALADGVNVVLENSYQKHVTARGVAMGLDEAILDALTSFLVVPDIAFYLDVAPHETFARKNGQVRH